MENLFYVLGGLVALFIVVNAFKMLSKKKSVEPVKPAKKTTKKTVVTDNVVAPKPKVTKKTTAKKPASKRGPKK